MILDSLEIENISLFGSVDRPSSGLGHYAISYYK